MRANLHKYKQLSPTICHVCRLICGDVDNNNNNTDNTEDLESRNRRESRNTGASPFSFTISDLGSFTCITQHTGPTALRPIRRTKQLWLSVLLKDTSAATGQARIQTHILTTSELESNALDRSATTLHFDTPLQQSTSTIHFTPIHFTPLHSNNH